MFKNTSAQTHKRQKGLIPYQTGMGYWLWSGSIRTPQTGPTLQPHAPGNYP